MKKHYIVMLLSILYISHTFSRDLFATTAQAKLAAHLLIMRDNEILLLLRENTGYYDGYWSIVGGKTDLGETVIETVIREAYEEVGIIIKPEALTCVHVVQKREAIDMSSPEWIVFYFVVREWSGEVSNKEPVKHSTIQWFSLDKMPHYILPHQAHALQCIRDGKFISCFDPNI